MMSNNGMAQARLLEKLKYAESRIKSQQLELAERDAKIGKLSEQNRNMCINSYKASVDSGAENQQLAAQLAVMTGERDAMLSIGRAIMRTGHISDDEGEHLHFEALLIFGITTDTGDVEPWRSKEAAQLAVMREALARAMDHWYLMAEGESETQLVDHKFALNALTNPNPAATELLERHATQLSEMREALQDCMQIVLAAVGKDTVVDRLGPDVADDAQLIMNRIASDDDTPIAEIVTNGLRILKGDKP